MKQDCWICAVILGVTLGLSANDARAVSPDSVALGRQLFEKNWTARNPTLGGDGLGPLFNARSCAACHNQGGVGGGGDSRFNAITVGIESLDMSGGMPVTGDSVARLLSQFHPGFIGADGAMKNTLPLMHHGGTSAFDSARTALLAQVRSQFSEEGGSTNSSEVRLANATPVLFTHKDRVHQISIRAKVFQRNTTALFGNGLIERVTSKDIENMAKSQKQHPEISGRPATLRDGRYGKFGWRGNIASLLDFCDQACAAELGLETRRKTQPRDDMNPEYRNSTFDISDDQIRAMRDFISALPAPSRVLPTDTEQQMMVARGEKAFNTVGCAVCHPSSMGPVTGIYSDLLLHDMGVESMDLNRAEPFFVSATPVSQRQQVSTDAVPRIVRPGSGSFGRGGSSYGGSSSSIFSSPGQSRDFTGNSKRFSSPGGRGKPGFAAALARRFRFEAPKQPQQKFEMVKLGREVTGEVRDKKTGNVMHGLKRPKNAKEITTIEKFMRLQIQPTNFNQEWRTPPLWGVRDSAPYMHDGRAETILESIAMHDGEAAGTRDRFLQLSVMDRNALLAFLDTFVAPSAAPQLAKADN